ncbi:cell division protein ZapE [Denitrificimonas caeni]|uniref:cell division protein ZapE n=1 Tax=Denitrificimonas caeni TaxID=521720 RepID=UPI0005262D04|nr:cell division protein ZapE [Denitrificimonas caeni]
MQQSIQLSPLQAYNKALTEGFVADPAQQQAVVALEECFQALQTGVGAVRGVYLWGPVGRGKTWLMEQFFNGLTVPARRQHFHHFIQDIHQRLFRLTGTAEPLSVIADELASEMQVLCFDELFVSDIADAMILGRLFQVLFAKGLVIVATSNQPPDELYYGGFNREPFLPAIAAIKQHMQAVAVQGKQDHRLHGGAVEQRYWVKTPAQASVFPELFNRLSAGEQQHTGVVMLGSRALITQAYSETVLCCEFSALCEQPFAALDFIRLCDRFKVLLLSRVPALSGALQDTKIARGTEDAVQRVVAGDRQLPALAPKDDSVRRFIALLDECYDRRIPVYIEAAVALDELYTEGYLTFAFRRTYSRLMEMQTSRFTRR